MGGSGSFAWCGECSIHQASVALKWAGLEVLEMIEVVVAMGVGRGELKMRQRFVRMRMAKKLMVAEQLLVREADWAVVRMLAVEHAMVPIALSH